MPASTSPAVQRRRRWVSLVVGIAFALRRAHGCGESGTGAAEREGQGWVGPHLGGRRAGKAHCAGPQQHNPRHHNRDMDPEPVSEDAAALHAGHADVEAGAVRRKTRTTRAKLPKTSAQRFSMRAS